MTELKNISNGENTANDLQRLERSVSRIAKGTMAVVTENQVTLMERYCGMSQRLNECLLCEPKGKININIRQEGVYLLLVQFLLVVFWSEFTPKIKKSLAIDHVLDLLQVARFDYGRRARDASA